MISLLRIWAVSLLALVVTVDARPIFEDTQVYVFLWY